MRGEPGTWGPRQPEPAVKPPAAQPRLGPRGGCSLTRCPGPASSRSVSFSGSPTPLFGAAPWLGLLWDPSALASPAAVPPAADPRMATMGGGGPGHLARRHLTRRGGSLSHPAGVRCCDGVRGPFSCTPQREGSPRPFPGTPIVPQGQEHAEGRGCTCRRAGAPAPTGPVSTHGPPKPRRPLT